MYILPQFADTHTHKVSPDPCTSTCTRRICHTNEDLRGFIRPLLAANYAIALPPLPNSPSPAPTCFMKANSQSRLSDLNINLRPPWPCRGEDASRSTGIRQDIPIRNEPFPPARPPCWSACGVGLRILDLVSNCDTRLSRCSPGMRM